MKINKNKDTFYNNLMRDWGKEDVYGPWTKNKKDNKLHFYKSYYFITTEGSPKIDIIKK